MRFLFGSSIRRIACLLFGMLTSCRLNYEKIIYQNLLKFRSEQEENFQGASIELSGSDYHHVTKRPVRRTATRSSLLGPGQKRSSSQFSIAEPPAPRHASTKSRGASSDADTETSYDPFRPSRHQMIPAEADHAKITLLNGSSTNSRGGKYASNTPSIRHPAVARLQREHSSIMGSSPPIVSRDVNGKMREIRRQTIPRQNTSSSWASTRSSRDGSMVFRKSMSYKRGVAFPHRQRNSSLQRTPPPRPRNPTPLTLQQRFVEDAARSERDPFTSPPPAVKSPSVSPPPVRSRKEGANGSAPDVDTKKKNRSSAIWEERTRQISAELSNLCDEVFQGSTSPPALLNNETEVEKLRKFARKSLDLPSFRSSEVDLGNQSEGASPRPLPEPPSQETKALKSYHELKQTRECLVKHAEALGSGELDSVINQIDRLIATTAARTPEQDHRRIFSAPDPRGREFQNLSPVREEDEASRWAADRSPRHVSEPVKGNRRYAQALQNVNAWKYPSTIRPVDDAELRPRPLTIKKKASEPVMRSPDSRKLSKTENNGLKGKLRSGNASTSALDKLFGASTKPILNKGQTEEDSVGPHLQPIGEHDNKENHDPKNVKRAPGDGKGTRWFRRSGGSVGSSGGNSAPDRAARHSVQSHQSDRLSDGRSQGTSNGPSDDIPFRAPQKQKESATSKFLKLFGKRDKRMHIATTCKYHGKPPQALQRNAAKYFLLSRRIRFHLLRPLPNNLPVVPLRPRRPFWPNQHPQR